MSPRLLTNEPDPRLPETNTVSGAGYLSRKMADPADAEAVISRTTEYTTRWLAPESTAARLGNPTILLIKNDTVVGRFASWRDASRFYDPEENIGRLNDLLKLADRDGEENDYGSTATNKHVVGGRSQATFQISDRNEFFEVEGIAAGQFNVTRERGGAGDIVFSLMQGAKTLAAGTNALMATLSAEDVAAGDFKLKVSAYANSSDKFFNPESGEPVGTTVFSAAFSSECVLLPEERQATFAPSEDSVKMVVESGKEYRLAGFTEDSLAASFAIKDGDHAIYTATADGEIVLTCDGKGESSYQLWRPGSVGFAVSSMTQVECETNVTIRLVRKNGTSGALSAEVSLADMADVPPERYGWTDQTVAWEDGDGDDKFVTVTLHDDVVFDGNQTLTFAFAVQEGYDVGTDLSELAFTIRENDEKTVGRLSITDTAPAFAKKMTIIAAAGSEVEITVSRLGGAETAVEGSLSATAGTFAGSGTAEQVFAWTDRDRVVSRTATLSLPDLAECPSKKVTVSLTGEGISTDGSARTLTIQLIADDAPMFAETAVTLTNLYRYVAFEQVAQIDLSTLANDGGAVTIAKVAGTQPAGVKIDWNSATGAFILSGTPTKAGTYVAQYQISEVRDGKKVVGGTIGVTFPIAEIGNGPDALNPSVATSRTFKDIPVVDTSAGRLAGVLTLTVPPSGRLSAKYTCKAGVKSLSCGAWADCAADGTLTAELYTRDRKYNISVQVAPDGTVNATVWDPDLPGDTIVASAGDMEPWSRFYTANDWRGVYTVAFVPKGLVAGNDRIASMGAAGLTLKITSASALKSGTVTYAGFLPNGTTISGSATLQELAGKDVCVLPLFKRSTTDCFSSLLSVSAGAADAYEQAAGADPTVQRAIVSADGVDTFWANANRKTAYADFEVKYAAYGSYYVAEQDLEVSLMNSEVLPQTAFTIATGDLPESDVLGACGEVSSAMVDVSGANISSKGVNLSFNKASGVVSGTFTLPFAVRAVTATYKAVVLPGWAGCGCTDGTDLPFFLGACWFADTFLYQEDWEACMESDSPYIRVPFKRGCAVSAETTAYGD